MRSRVLAADGQRAHGRSWPPESPGARRRDRPTRASTVSGTQLTIYASAAPTDQPQVAQDVLDAEQLAFAAGPHRVGNFTIRMATVRGATLSAQARTVIQDKSAIAYLGEVVPGSSAAFARASPTRSTSSRSAPTDTALELTETTSGGRERPRRVLRVAQHLRADVRARACRTAARRPRRRSRRCTRSGSRSSTSPRTEATTERRSRTRSARTPVALGSPSSAAPPTADGAFYGSASPAAAARFFNGVAGSNPSAKLFGPSALDAPAFVRRAVTGGAEPVHLGPRVPQPRSHAGRKHVRLAIQVGLRPHARRRRRSSATRRCRRCSPCSSRPARRPANRTTVVHDFFAIKNRQSVLGTYSIDSDGDTSLAPFVFTRLQSGQLVPVNSSSAGVRLATASKGATRRTVAVAAALAAVLLAALVVAGCGSSSGHTLAASRIRGRTLTIYASAPLLGRSSVTGQAVVSGARLALDQVGARIGEYRIAFKTLDDATAARGGWDPGQTTINARLAVLDPTTIGYVGEVDSGASAISIPPLNRAGIPQVSPTSAAVGLTSRRARGLPRRAPEVLPDRDTHVRSGGPRRQDPGDRPGSRAAEHGLQVDLRAQRRRGRRRGRGAGASRSPRRPRICGSPASRTFVRDATSYKSLAAAVAQIAPDCVLIAADTESGAVLLTTQIAAAMPQVKIFGTADLAESDVLANPAAGRDPAVGRPARRPHVARLSG